MLRRGIAGVGALMVVAALVLALVPIGHEGVSGNAIQPTYESFGWFSYAPLPEHATVSELRAAGVQVPAYAVGSRHAVTQRRWLVGVLAGIGVVLITGSRLVRRRDL